MKIIKACVLCVLMKTSDFKPIGVSTSTEREWKRRLLDITKNSNVASILRSETECEIFGDRAQEKSSISYDGGYDSQYGSYHTGSALHNRRNKSFLSVESENNETSRRKVRINNILGHVHDWLNIRHLPTIKCRVEPVSVFKVRKTFRPLKTIVKIGADFNPQLGVWQFKSSWKDSIIGGKLTLAGGELEYSKTWLLSVGAFDDLLTRLRLRAVVDLSSMKGYARLGFRTERLSPINIAEGFTLMRRLPLDGTNGNLKLEVKANFAFPKPEIEYSTHNSKPIVAMGDIEVNIDELNLLLNY